MLTDASDLVYDPFAGSCVTGEVAERLKRRWICSEILEEYLCGAKLRFSEKLPARDRKKVGEYSISHPAALWNGIEVEELLSQDGGKKRVLRVKKKGKDKLLRDKSNARVATTSLR